MVIYKLEPGDCVSRIKYLVLAALTLACSVNCNVTATVDLKQENAATGVETEKCKHKEISSSYLDMAVDMITKANENLPACNGPSVSNQKVISEAYLDMATLMIRKAEDKIPTCRNSEKNTEGGTEKTKSRTAADCADLLFLGHNTSGVYEIWPMTPKTENSMRVYCDMETTGGGWTVIQRRGEFQSPEDYFYKDWQSYKEGFGDVEKDFWLGNDNIFILSNYKEHSVRFDLRDVEGGQRYALYDDFRIEDEIAKYKIHLSGYSGDAGDAMTYHNNRKFSTKDQDNDSSPTNCAERLKGAWWYQACYHCNLNGINRKGRDDGSDYRIMWRPWKGERESLEWTEIKIRPKNFEDTFM